MWTIIIPVKSFGAAKSRLGSGADSADLARAFLRDVLTAASGSARVRAVVVATGDQQVADEARGAGCIVVDDSGHYGINAAAAWAVASHSPTGPVAVLVSDLPCLTTEALDVVFERAAEATRAFLPDLAGTGTTMLMARLSSELRPAFGPDSAAAHRSQGFEDLAAGAPDDSLLTLARRDVDTTEDLEDARRLGLGSATARVTAGLIVVTALAATDEGTSSAVDESGRLHPLDDAALAAAGFREVHAGQRLLLHADGHLEIP